MRRFDRLAWLALFAALPLSAPAAGEEWKPRCLEKLPPEWERWGGAAELPERGPIAPGTSYDVPLVPVAELALEGVDAAELPETSRGAVLTLTIEREGTYDFALGQPIWVDVIADGEVLEPLPHDLFHNRRPLCTSIAKVVPFTLAPGEYRIELSGAETDSVQLLVR